MDLCRCRRIVFSLASGGLLLIGLFLLLNGTPPVARADPGDLFVVPAGAGTACTQALPCALPTALSQATGGDTIYIAEGTYTGTGGAVISITTSVTLYGGWDGAASGPVARDPVAHPTTVDGEAVRRGVYVSGGITVTLEGFTVTNGVASVKGAGLYANHAHLTLREMIFSGNVISTTATGHPYGGGAMVEGGTLQVDASTFRANSVWSKTDSSGGGLAISRTLTATVENSLFQDNDAWSTSGLYFLGPAGGRAPFTVRHSRFLDNGWGHSPGPVKGGYSGAMRIMNANAQVEDNAVIHNRAANGWGAVHVKASELLLARNVFYDNTSYYHASGLYLQSVSSFTVTNNLIVDNQSTYDWMQHQCVDIDASHGQMLHNTIARNTNTYGIKVENGATVALTNTILVSHTVGITVTTGSTAILEATLWYNNGTNTGGGGTLISSANVYSTPAFVNPTARDYHLSAGSAAIDAGVDAGVTNDLDGYPRLGVPDIGAYEYLQHVYLPLVLKNYP